MRTFYFILKSIFGGLFLYAVAGLLMAFIMVTFFGNEHPHSIDEILYFVVPMFIGAIGSVLGLVFSIVYMQNHSISKVKKYLLICLPISILGVTLFLYY